MKFNIEKDKLLILLILADLAYIILHILHTYTGLLPGEYFSLEKDGGFGEFFQYTKELWLVILFFMIGMKKRGFLYIIFSLLFLYFLIDDSFEFHERFGAFLAHFLNLQPKLGLRAIDFGELVVSGFFGALFLLAIVITFYQSDLPTKTVSKYILGMVVLLAIFGMIIDMIEVIVEHPMFNPILVMVEEGGEMLVMSVITWFVYRLDPAGERIFTNYENV